MKAKIMSSFAAGIIVAAGVSGTVYYTTPPEVSSKEIKVQPSEGEMKESLASAGYRVFTEQEWEKEIAAFEKTQQALQKEKEAAEAEQKLPDEKIIYKTILNVASGMTSIDVGNALVQGKIIEDAMSFFNEVEKRGVANNLRPGMYELDSEMTVDEVINIIFK